MKATLAATRGSGPTIGGVESSPVSVPVRSRKLDLMTLANVELAMSSTRGAETSPLTMAAFAAVIETGSMICVVMTENVVAGVGAPMYAPLENVSEDARMAVSHAEANAVAPADGSTVGASAAIPDANVASANTKLGDPESVIPVSPALTTLAANHEAISVPAVA